jgi:hypothetical protein
MTATTSPTRLLYIGGFGRSGSTLLERMIGQVDTFCSVGEVRHVWKRGVVENQLCGCGARFHDCPFWRAVGDVAFGGWPSVDTDRIIGLDREVDRHRHVPFLIVPGIRPKFGRHLDEYAEVLGALYAAVRQVSGANVVIDSTADPSYALILRRTRSIDMRVTHLVRDARGVAYSWTKRVVRPEITDEVVYMPTYRPGVAAVLWLSYNALFEALRPAGVPRHLVKYEELIRDPRAQLRAILRFAGREATPDDLDFVRDEGLDLRPTHTVAGNPMRFESAIKLRLDEAWRWKMSRQERITVSSIAWPLLVKYGYLPDRRTPTGDTG